MMKNGDARKTFHDEVCPLLAGKVITENNVSWNINDSMLMFGSVCEKIGCVKQMHWEQG